MDEKPTTGWFDPLFRTEAMRRVFCDRERLQGMLDFEAALANVLAMVGVISPSAAETIASQCHSELYDIGDLSQASAVAGNSAIPMIHELERLVANKSEEVARYVHFGATSQDAMDTGLMLQMREAIGLIAEDITNLLASLARLAAEHKGTPLVGRTWLQQAAPITFGLKVAGWFSALARHRERIDQLRPRCLVLQLGGPVGTLAAYGDRAQQITALMADKLKLYSADVPWHGHRDRLAEVAATLGLLIGTLGKMARDISLLSQSEIAEVSEPAAPGRGGSSSMPQKRNPVGCAVVLAGAMRVPALVSVMLSAMPQEHERGLGGWQAEWETLPEIFEHTAGALAQMRHIVAGLSVKAEQMQSNIDASRGLLYAEAVSAVLAQRIGRAAAHALVERACRRTTEEFRDLGDVLADDPEIASLLSVAERKQLCDHQRHTSAAAELVDHCLAANVWPKSSWHEEDA